MDYIPPSRASCPPAVGWVWACLSTPEAGQRTPQEAGGGCPLTVLASTLLSHRLACQGSLADLSRLPAAVPGAPSGRHPALERRKPHRGRRGEEAGGRRGQEASANPGMRRPRPRPAQALFYGMYCMPPQTSHSPLSWKSTSSRALHWVKHCLPPLQLLKPNAPGRGAL